MQLANNIKNKNFVVILIYEKGIDCVCPIVYSSAKICCFQKKKTNFSVSCQKLCTCVCISRAILSKFHCTTYTYIFEK